MSDICRCCKGCVHAQSCACSWRTARSRPWTASWSSSTRTRTASPLCHRWRLSLLRPPAEPWSEELPLSVRRMAGWTTSSASRKAAGNRGYTRSGADRRATGLLGSGCWSTEACRGIEGCVGMVQVISVPPLGPGESAGAEVPVAQNPAMSNPAANPAIIQVRRRGPMAYPTRGGGAPSFRLLCYCHLQCCCSPRSTGKAHSGMQAASFFSNTVEPRQSCVCVQVAVRNNQQGVLYFSSPFNPEVLAAQSSASSTDFFVSLPPVSAPTRPVHRPWQPRWAAL